mgnify:CR=1 FL=1
MGYCKITGRSSCSFVDNDVGLCARSSGKCIYEEDDDDYREIEEDYDDSDECESD